jgi:hypothetical protein
VTWLPTSTQAIRFIDPVPLGLFIGAALALINTPRLSDIRDSVLGRLNRKRDLKGLPPIMEHKIVRLRIDRGEMGIGIQKSATEGRSLHHVRAFMRIKRGRIEIVRPHWRGNPKFGVIQHRYIAVREEDDAGPWMGGPLPAKRFMRKSEGHG